MLPGGGAPRTAPVVCARLAAARRCWRFMGGGSVIGAGPTHFVALPYPRTGPATDHPLSSGWGAGQALQKRRMNVSGADESPRVQYPTTVPYKSYASARSIFTV